MMDTIQSKGTKRPRAEIWNPDDVFPAPRRPQLLYDVEEVSVKLSDVKNNVAESEHYQITIEAEVKRATGQEVELAGSIKVMAGQIEQKVSAGDLVAKINLEANKSGSKIVMEAGHFVLKGTNFWVNEDGSGGAANGNLTWNAAGKLKWLIGMERGYCGSHQFDRGGCD